jgi:hypothetical protein
MSLKCWQAYFVGFFLFVILDFPMSNRMSIVFLCFFLNNYLCYTHMTVRKTSYKVPFWYTLKYLAWMLQQTELSLLPKPDFHSQIMQIKYLNLGPLWCRDPLYVTLVEKLKDIYWLIWPKAASLIFDSQSWLQSG